MKTQGFKATEREGSDGRVVPQGRRKASSTAARRGGKATTANEQVGQLDLFFETADSPQGADGGAAPKGAEPREVPKSKNDESMSLPTMTMEEVATEANLKRALKQVASNKGAPGVDKQTVMFVREHEGDVLPCLRRALLDGSYRPGSIRRVWIPKPHGGQRGLGIPNVVDRIVQQAVLQIVSPHYVPTFHGSSHGFRPGRSCHTAIAQARKYLEDGYEWVVDLDLEKFFDRVHHDRLMARLKQRIRDERLLRVIHQMLKAKVVLPEGVVVSTEEGVPQGGPLSPLLSNIVLDELDWELEQRGHRFVRYADDSNIYVRSERSGQRVMASITRFIETRLRLRINRDKSAVARPGERHFLGFTLRREPLSGESEVLLSNRSQERVNDKLRQMTPRNWGDSLRECIRRLNVYLRGWYGYFEICTEAATGMLRQIDGHLRRRLRAIILRQWKRKRSIVRKLLKLGAQPWLAWNSVYKGNRSWWALSNCQPVKWGLNRTWFRTRDLFSLEQNWVDDHAPNLVIASPQGEIIAGRKAGSGAVSNARKRTTRHGETVNPPRNRKSGRGNPSPTANESASKQADDPAVPKSRM